MTCSRCGKPFDALGPRGVCVHCVLESALLPSADALESVSAQNRAQSQHAPGNAHASADRSGEVAGSPEPARSGTVVLARFGDYELLEEIARGGMGIVYKARQVSLNRLVALKMILSGQFASKQEVLRFRVEAEAAANLRHPNIVAIYETGEHQGQHFFSMEYVAGPNLSQLVGNRPLNAQLAARYTLAIARAIHYAHGQNTLHRDLKPSNVLVDADDQPRITDFGLMRRLRGPYGLTVTGQMLGSPNFMPPEQCGMLSIRSSRREEAHFEKSEIRPAVTARQRGENPKSETEQAKAKVTDGALADRQSEIENHKSRAGPWSDVYGIGAILYHLLTARPPFQAETVQDVLLQLRERDPVAPRLLNPSVPRDLETICLKCLEKEPDRRYATADELADDLDRFLKNEPILARPVGRAERVWRWCRRKPALASFVAATSVLLLAILIGSPIALIRIDRERLRADAEATEARHGIYAADMAIAQTALGQNDVGRARKLLSRHIPQAGSPDLRGWEWRYLWKQCQSDELTTLDVLSNAVSLVRYSPDGRQLIAGDFDGNLVLWDMLRHAAVVRTNLLFSHSRVNFSPDGALLALVGYAGTNFFVRLWETSSFHEMALIAQSTNEIDWLSFAPEGNRLLAISESVLRTWDLSGNEVERQDLPPGRPSGWWSGGQDFTTNRQTLVLVQEGNLLLWDARKHSIQASIRGPWKPGSFEPTTFCLSGDGRLLAVGHPNRKISIWNALNGQLITNLTAHRGWSVALTFSPDNHRLITSSHDQTLRTWDTTTWTELGRLQGHENEVWSLTMSPDGETLISGGKDGAVKVWNATPRRAAREILTFPGSETDLVPSPDGYDFAAPGTNEIQIIESRTLREIRRVSTRVTNQTVLALSSGARWVACRGESNKVELLETETGQAQTLPLQVGDPIERGEFSPDGHWLALATPESRVFIWEIPAKRVTRQFEVNASWPTCLRFSPDSKVLLTSHGNRMRRASMLWRVETGERLVELLGHRQSVEGAAFSSNGKQVATTSEDGTTRVWDAVTGRQIASLRGQLAGAFSVAFSPDSTRLVTGNGGGPARLYDIAREQELTSLHNLTDDVRTGAIFFLDEDTIVGASRQWGDARQRSLILWTAAPLISSSTAAHTARTVEHHTDTQ